MSRHENAVLTALNHTDICTFTYLPEQKRVLVPEKTQKRYNTAAVYENMPDSFANEFVCEDDFDAFCWMFRCLDQGQDNAANLFVSKDRNVTCRVTLSVMEQDEKGHALSVLGLVEDVSELVQGRKTVEQLKLRLSLVHEKNSAMQEAMELINKAVTGQFEAVLHIWMDSRTYICFKEDAGGQLKQSDADAKKKFDLNAWIDEECEPQDREDLRAFVSFENFAKQLENKDSISHEYRSIKRGWLRGTFLAAKRERDGRVSHVVYTITDINEEKQREQELERTRFEGEHDALTSVYNRKGFERISRQLQQSGTRVGFLLLDIDNFKQLNDQHGHELGDQALTLLAHELLSVFREEDAVFRLGGDEFCVLMQDCNEEMWPTLCRKLNRIHTSLEEHFMLFTDVRLTLSVGVCFSSYRDDLYQLADEALYETKYNGRSGCTLINEEHVILKRWHDTVHGRKKNELNEEANTGFFRLEIPFDKEQPRRLYCGNETKHTLGLRAESGPEECYRTWFNGIDPAYRKTVLEAGRIMLEEGQAECFYLWNHPQFGKIIVRSGGFGEVDSDKVVLHGYEHAVKDTRLVNTEDEDSLLLSALSETYFCAYYFDLKAGTYRVVKAGPGEETLQVKLGNDSSMLVENFLDQIVLEEDQANMREFMDLSTLPVRLNAKRAVESTYMTKLMPRWCRARFIAVRYDEDGTLTHALFVISLLDADTADELDVSRYNRRSLSALFDHVPGGVVMYEWNGTQMKVLHISSFFEEQYSDRLLKKQPGTMSYDFSQVHPDDLSGLRAAIAEAIAGSHEIHHVYRLYNVRKKHYVYVKLDAIADPQKDNTYLIYAIYTDISEQKDTEHRMSKVEASLRSALSAGNQLCYEYDPLMRIGRCYTETNFFNLPVQIENYPDSLKDMDLFAPEDADKFISTCHSMDEGRESAQCDVRIKTATELRWYNCSFTRIFDAIKERPVVVLTVTDITVRTQAMKNYEERMQALLGIRDQVLNTFTINVTKNVLEEVHVREGARGLFENCSYDQAIENVSRLVVGEEDQKRYVKTFCRAHLLELAAQGQTSVFMVYLQKALDGRYEWIHAQLDLLTNPITEEITAVSFSRSAQDEKITALLLKKMMDQETVCAATIFKDTDEFYLYRNVKNHPPVRMDHFWQMALTARQADYSAKVKAGLEHLFNKERVLNRLDQYLECSYVFEAPVNASMHRFKISFSYLDEAGTMILASMRDITDNELMRRLRHESEHDPLTDLYNRRRFLKACRKMLTDYPDETFTMVHVDMKNFHRYNTFFGDEAGDRLLCDVADMFMSINEEMDHWVVARIEADVFAILSPYDEKRFLRHRTYIKTKLNNYRDDFLVEPKFGVYMVKDKQMPVESMLQRATLAAKQIKSSSAENTEFYSDAMELKLRREQELVSEMHAALDQEQFEVWLQPKVRLADKKVVGAEALVRWNHPHKGMIPPSEFIPIFERNGFILDLDRYMWTKTCALLKNLGDHACPISVNVSRISMFSPSTVPYLLDLVKTYDLDPQLLELELTETAYIENPDEIKPRLQALRTHGFKLLMDDFGSGYSSLNTLKDIPVDILKLDMKFLSDQADERGDIVLRSVVHMSHDLQLPIVAEGVETKEQADQLEQLGCAYAQGYFFGKPMPNEQFKQQYIK